MHIICKLSQVREQIINMPNKQIQQSDLSGAGCTSGSNTEVCKLCTSSKMSGAKFSLRSLKLRLKSPDLLFIFMSTAILQGSSTEPCTLSLSTASSCMNVNVKLMLDFTFKDHLHDDNQTAAAQTAVRWNGVLRQHCIISTTCMLRPLSPTSAFLRTSSTGQRYS